MPQHANGRLLFQALLTFHRLVESYHDIELRTQLSGRPLADELKQVEHHLAEIEALLAQIKKK